MSASIEAKVTQRLSHPPEAVFNAWLEPDLVRAWMARSLVEAGLPGEMMRVEIDAEVGGRFAFSDKRAQGEALHWGEYRVIDTPHRLAFTWWTSPEEEAADRSLVTIVLEPSDEGCVATLYHEMDAVWAAYLERTERSWARMLTAIAQELDQRGS